jgi:hypothetical protein
MVVMRNDGRELEEFVANVEKTLSNEGFQVNVNRKLYNDEGVQIAEFDVILNGRFGSTEISWLIECRDRPSSGKAPGEWIYALASKREVHQFNKVTAVSTTGFSPAAVLASEKLNVELREITATSPEELRSWLQLVEVELVQHDISLADIDFVFDKNFITPERDQYVQQLTSSPDGRQRAVLVSGVTGYRLNLHTACREALASAGGFNVVKPGDDAAKIDMTVEYEAADAHLLMETPDGNVRIRKIRFQGSVRAVLKKFPVIGHSVYREVCSGGAIAQTASARIPLPSGEAVALSFIKVTGQDQYHVNWKAMR